MNLNGLSGNLRSDRFLFLSIADWLRAEQHKLQIVVNGMGDSIIGRNNDGTLNEDCSKWCYVDGTYTYHNMDELLDICVKNMVNENFTEEQARSYMK